MVLIFHSFKGFSDLDLDMKVFQIWKTSGMTYQKSYGLPGSRLTESSHMSLPFITDLSVLMVLIFHSFKDLEDFWDDLLVSRLKYNALDDFQEVPDDFQEVF
uniref:Uncharacterized protein n=1 Tax=Brassica oleracea var. oleracea TaxID=109376 RepID=A0A0D3AA52_BRAOL